MNNTLLIVLVVVLVLLAIGGVPAVGFYSHGYPTIGLGTILLIVIVILLLR